MSSEKSSEKSSENFRRRAAERGRSQQTSGRGAYGTSYGSDAGFDRRGWREGSDYYGNRDASYGRSDYGESYEGPQGYPRDYDDAYGTRAFGARDNDRWQRERSDYADDLGKRGYGGDEFGRSASDDEGSYGIGGYGRDLSYGRRGALGYGGYGGMGGAQGASGAYRSEGAGYAQQEQHRGRGPRGYKRADERIREDVCEWLTDDPHLDASNIEVAAKDCEVTLTGTVSSRQDKRRAEDLAELVSGVAEVHNRLRVARAP